MIKKDLVKQFHMGSKNDVDMLDRSTYSKYVLNCLSHEIENQIKSVVYLYGSGVKEDFEISIDLKNYTKMIPDIQTLISERLSIASWPGITFVYDKDLKVLVDRDPLLNFLKVGSI